MIDMLKSAILTIILTTLFLTVSVLAMIAFGCTLDTSPDHHLYRGGDRLLSLGAPVPAPVERTRAQLLLPMKGDNQFRACSTERKDLHCHRHGSDLMVVNSTCSGERCGWTGNRKLNHSPSQANG